MSAIPVNDWGVIANVTVAATTEAAAQTALATALTDIKSALVTLNNGSSFSVNEYQAPDESDEGQTEGPTGGFAFEYLDEVNGGFYVQGQLLVASVAQAQAQSAAEAAATAIATAIAGVTPAVTVSLENGPDGYNFNLLQ